MADFFTVRLRKLSIIKVIPFHFMKSAILRVFVLTMLVFFFGCKKGEEDPRISLRTRKARLAGEWRLKNGSASYTIDNYNENYLFDGTRLRMTTTQLGPPVYYTGTYILNLDIS